MSQTKRGVAGDEKVKNALTFDIEEHFQVHNFERAVGRRNWNQYGSRVVANTQRILALLAEHRVHATFFVLGWVADRHPVLVEEIAAAGHEIASHGYWHELVYRQTRREFADDLDAAHKAIWAALGVGISTSGERRLGYRAPSFSITTRSWWALEILEDKGYLYDSSISPTALNKRCSNPGAARFPSRIFRDLLEIPMSTVSVAGHNFPVAGGGYFRLAPFVVTREAMRQINKEGHAAVVYLHPWEFDLGQPRIGGASVSSRFRHYVNLAKTEPRLEKLLKQFEFGPLREVFGAELDGLSPVVDGPTISW